MPTPKPETIQRFKNKGGADQPAPKISAQNGKGSSPRPVDPDKYAENYQRIFGHAEPLFRLKTSGHTHSENPRVFHPKFTSSKRTKECK